MLTTRSFQRRTESHLRRLTQIPSRRWDDDPEALYPETLYTAALTPEIRTGGDSFFDAGASVRPVVQAAQPERATRDAPGDITVILELDRQQFARAVYRAYREESRRVGVKLTEGGEA